VPGQVCFFDLENVLLFFKFLLELSYFSLLLIDFRPFSCKFLLFQFPFERVGLQNGSFLRYVFDCLLGFLAVFDSLSVDFSGSCYNLFFLSGKVLISVSLFSFLLKKPHCLQGSLTLDHEGSHLVELFVGDLVFASPQVAIDVFKQLLYLLLLVNIHVMFKFIIISVLF
jgi:hypothetical protein